MNEIPFCRLFSLISHSDYQGSAGTWIVVVDRSNVRCLLHGDFIVRAWGRRVGGWRDSHRDPRISTVSVSGKLDYNSRTRGRTWGGGVKKSKYGGLSMSVITLYKLYEPTDLSPPRCPYCRCWCQAHVCVCLLWNLRTSAVSIYSELDRKKCTVEHKC